MSCMGFNSFKGVHWDVSCVVLPGIGTLAIMVGSAAS